MWHVVSIAAQHRWSESWELFLPLLATQTTDTQVSRYLLPMDSSSANPRSDLDSSSNNDIFYTDI